MEQESEINGIRSMTPDLLWKFTQNMEETNQYFNVFLKHKNFIRNTFIELVAKLRPLHLPIFPKPNLALGSVHMN